MSHIAAVVPLGKQRSIPLPIAALAIGSMTPDLLYYVPGLINVGVYLHQPRYAFTAGLLLALCAWALWRLLAPGINSICPECVRARWQPEAWNAYPGWSVILGVQGGIATHLFLDSFTHSWGWAARNVGILEATYPLSFGDMAGYEIAQNALSALGVVALAVLAFRVEPVRRNPSPTPALQLTASWAVPCAALLGALVRTAVVSGFDSRYEALAFYLLTGAVMGAVSVTVILSLIASAFTTRLRAKSNNALRGTSGN